MLTAHDFSVENGKVIIDRAALAQALAAASEMSPVNTPEDSIIIDVGPDFLAEDMIVVRA